MSSFLLWSNIHLGLELFGAIAFFLVGWLFFEAFAIKRDGFSFARGTGAMALALTQVLHASYVQAALPVAGGATLGLALLAGSYAWERLPARPGRNLAAGILGAAPAGAAPAFFGITLSFFLIRRYFKDIDKPLGWFAVGMSFFALSGLIEWGFPSAGGNAAWVIDHVVRSVAFIAVAEWAGVLISLRIREEVLAVFVTLALLGSLILTATFSWFFLAHIERETMRNLSVSAKLVDARLDQLKSGSLAAGLTMARQGRLVAALASEDRYGDLGTVAAELFQSSGMGFLVIARENGVVVFKSHAPIGQNENISAEAVGARALAGQAGTATAWVSGSVSIRAAAPVYDEGNLVGAIITGYYLDERFIQGLKKLIGLETTIAAQGTVAESTVFPKGERMTAPGTGGAPVRAIRLGNQDVYGAFVPIREEHVNEDIATIALTTSPGELLRDAESTSRLTLFIILLITLGFIVPLYRFTVYLTT